jgi:DNA-binding NarL/FixJ family response regulator
VDDFEPWRQRICSALKARPGLLVVGEASDGLEAVRMAEQLKPDLILLDIGLPNLNGIDAAHRMRKAVPGMKILFLSQNSDAEVIQTALSDGAIGYILKADAGRQLLGAVETVLRGEKFVSSGVKRKQLWRDSVVT